MSLSEQQEFLHKKFEQQVLRSPDTIALRYGEEYLSYGELNSRANQVANKISERLRGHETKVGLFMTRSLDFVVAMLAVLKAGAVYVPIDPDYPAERISYLLSDSDVAIILSRKADMKFLPMGRHAVLMEDMMSRQEMKNSLQTDFSSKAAYVIYTSGSTGKPKGTIVEHNNVLALFDNCQGQFNFSDQDIWSVFHSFSFDFSVWEIWGALLYGGTAVIIPAKLISLPLEFAQYVESSRISILSMTPTAFQQFAKAALASGLSFPDLKQIILGGEKLEAAHVENWLNHFDSKKIKLVNMYGITETTIHVTYREITKDFLECPDLSPIGMPVKGMNIHLLDEDDHPVPEGETGEIVVTGCGVARGYLDRSKLNSQRFPMLPLGHDDRLIRAYRSGDLARFEKGEFFYMGRIDDQVKVRGYRIEPREIELHLEQSSDVAHCKVVVQKLGEGDCRLIAFIVPGDGRAIEGNNDLLDRLKILAGELPDYMQPSRMVKIARLPITLHGKCDEKSLLNQLEATETKPEIKTETETKSEENASVGGHEHEDHHYIAGRIAEISQNILHQQNLSWQEDIFDQGGTSLSFVRILLAINKDFNTSLSGSELQGDASISNMASVIQTMTNTHNQKKEAIS